MRQIRTGAATTGWEKRARRLISSLRRTIAVERTLLSDPVFTIRAAHVIVHARSEIRRIERRSPDW
jgi:hypothetical protein